MLSFCRFVFVYLVFVLARDRLVDFGRFTFPLSFLSLRIFAHIRLSQVFSLVFNLGHIAPDIISGHVVFPQFLYFVFPVPMLPLNSHTKRMAQNQQETRLAPFFSHKSKNAQSHTFSVNKY